MTKISPDLLFYCPSSGCFKQSCELERTGEAVCQAYSVRRRNHKTAGVLWGMYTVHYLRMFYRKMSDISVQMQHRLQYNPMYYIRRVEI